MKRLLFLLFIPILSYSQITYKDVMSINSEKTFKRVVIENGFEFDKSDEEYIGYGMNINRDSINGNKSKLWSRYSKINGEFNFQFSLSSSFYGLTKDLTDESPYNSIIEKVKKNCKFYDIIEKNGLDYVCYSCPQSTYKGKIGFTKSEGSGMIRHIIPTKPITYKDVMSINSDKTFYKVMIENGYEFLENTDSIIVFGIDVNEDSLETFYDEWVLYEKTNGEFRIKFNIDEDNDEDSYNVLLDDIKNNCTFYDTLKNSVWTYDYVSYSCSESTYEGKISYVITDSMSYISHIIPTTD